MLLLRSIKKNPDRSMVLRGSHLSSLSFRIRVCHPNTRIYVRLLGPCFKTGRLKPFRQHPKHWCGKPTGLPTQSRGQQAVCKTVSGGDWVPKKCCSPQSNPRQDQKL